MRPDTTVDWSRTERWIMPATIARPAASAKSGRRRLAGQVEYRPPIQRSGTRDAGFEPPHGTQLRVIVEGGRSDQPMFFNNESRGRGIARGVRCAFQVDKAIIPGLGHGADGDRQMWNDAVRRG